MNSAEDAQMAIPKKEPRHFLLTSIENKNILVLKWFFYMSTLPCQFTACSTLEPTA